MKRLLIMLASALVLVAGAVVVDEPAAMAAGCGYTGCSGKDPKAQGCAGSGKTLRTMWAGTIRIDLRYSMTCHAAWARWTLTHDLWYGEKVLVRRYNINNVQTGQYTTTTGLDKGNSGWTKMIGLPRTTPSHFKACDIYHCTAPG